MSDPPVKTISRRDFLKLAGVTVGGLSAGSLLFSELLAVPAPILKRLRSGPGLESFINTVCGQCPAGCGLTVRRVDGVPIGVKGNPIFPVNRGGVCPMAHASLESLFHPDRLREPQVLDGGQWHDSDWDSVLADLAGRLGTLIAHARGPRLALINGNPSPVIRRICRTLLDRAGSPYYFESGLPNDGTLPVVLSHGTGLTPSYDVGQANFILSFGGNFLEEDSAPVYYQRIFSAAQGLRGNGHELVCIDSRLNLTAAKADRWVPIRPGTYTALALGIANVLIVDNLYDRQFVRRQCSGFEPYRDSQGNDQVGFEAFVREHYYPERVAGITGVPARTIIELGDKFGTSDAPLAISGSGAASALGGSMAQWAVYCLNALANNFQGTGGINFQPPLPQPAGEGKGDSNLAAAGVGPFLDSLANGTGPDIGLLIIIDANPLYNSRNKEAATAALAKIGHVTSLGTMPDETAAIANSRLPTHHWLESHDLGGPVPGLDFNHVGYRQPVVEPLFNTRETGDLLLEIGRRALRTELFPMENYRQLIDAQLRALYNSGVGAVISRSMDDTWLAQMRERGWQLQQYDSFGAFKRLIAENGGWWDPIMPRLRTAELFATPSGKFEFVSSHLRYLSRKPGSVPDEASLMPHQEELAPEGTGDYPLTLTTGWLLTNRNGTGAAYPSMLEMIGIQSEHSWESWLDINPRTAEEYNLQDRQPVWVESPVGRIKVMLHAYAGIRPGVVHLALGLGHTSLGRYGTGIGVNATDVIENRFDHLSGAPALNGARVRLIPAAGLV